MKIESLRTLLCSTIMASLAKPFFRNYLINDTVFGVQMYLTVDVYSHFLCKFNLIFFVLISGRI